MIDTYASTMLFSHANAEGAWHNTRFHFYNSDVAAWFLSKQSKHEVNQQYYFPPKFLNDISLYIFKALLIANTV